MMDVKRKGLHVGYGLLLAIATLGAPSAYADDIEVFVNTDLAGIAPNLIFSLDLSGSMNRAPDGTASAPTRLDILKQAMTDVMNDPDLPEINVGFTYFRHSQGSGIKFPAARLGSDANSIDPSIPAGTLVKDVIEGMIAATNANYATPTVDSFWEVSQYIRGAYPTFGKDYTFGTWNSGSMQYTGGTAAGGMADGWLAANPVSYTGGVDYVSLASPTGWNDTCDDRTMSDPPGSDGCAGHRAAGAPMSCSMIPVAGQSERTCNSTTCDAGCGSSCTAWSPYVEPASCIANSSGATWVTGWSGGDPSQCCTQADSGLNECTQTQNYSRSCTASVCSGSRPYKAPTELERCTFRREDTRRYISPITQQCQKTAVVLLTDGDPSVNNVDRGAVNGSGNAVAPYRIRNLIASADATLDVNDIKCEDYSDEFGSAPGTRPYGNCAKELAEFLHKNDQVPAYPGSTVDTYAIGFGLTGPGAAATWGYLQDVTNAGGGEAIEASDYDTLVSAFKQIIASVSSDNQSFSGYTTTMNSSILQTGDKAYLAMFDPKDARAWSGNVKGYYVIDGKILDVNGDPATDIDPISNDTVFKSSSRSFWSSGADGNSVLSGGIVARLMPATRDIYVITNAGETANVNLADGNHDLDTANASLTAAAMGMPAAATPAERSDMIDWARSQRIGDPLHSEPRVVTYGAGIGEVLYITTNQGYLHAIDVTNPTAPGDTSGGGEIFAFMPNQLLGSLQTQRAGNVAGSHIYGLDGSLTTWITDVDGNGKVDDPADKAYLYFGMRRGGKSYFAMDVTDPYAPKLAWQINGGTPGYEFLGESWSQMSLAVVNDGGSPRRVLVFGGGYDSGKQDVPDTARDPLGEDFGMGIYIVDATTGALLNSIGADDPLTPAKEFKMNIPGMRYSMAADLRTEDTDGNGYVDRLYAVDTGAQIWRVDLVEGASISAAAGVKPYRFADLSGVGIAGNRRFYYPPSVAHTTRNNVRVTVLALGSGYRAHPLNTATDDQFYLLVDSNSSKGPPAFVPAPLTVASLYDATANTLQTATGVAKATELALLEASDGWYINLTGDEKVLVRSRIYQNYVFFNTFESGVADPCEFAGGTNRFYAVRLHDATGAIEQDVDNDGVVDLVVRGIVVDDQAAILSEPTIVTQAAAGGALTSPEPFCSTIFAGSTAVMKICEAPTRVNWQTLQ